MNKRVTKLFSCCLDNRVKVIDTNFDSFCNQFKNLEPQARSCRWFINKFKEQSEFQYTLNEKVYFFQQLV